MKERKRERDKGPVYVIQKSKRYKAQKYHYEIRRRGKKTRFRCDGELVGGVQRGVVGQREESQYGLAGPRASRRGGLLTSDEVAGQPTKAKTL